MITCTRTTYGIESQERLDKIKRRGIVGARAALEASYYSLNHQDLEALARNWTDEPFAQLNNPLGGIVRGADAITDLYRRIFSGTARVQVAFGDIIEYVGANHALFAGQESGSYTLPGQEPKSLANPHHPLLPI